jgi:hypothetical protein
MQSNCELSSDPKPMIPPNSPCCRGSLGHKYVYIKKSCWALVAPLEAEIGRIVFPGQPRHQSSQDPIWIEKAGCGGAHLSSQLQQVA